MMLKDPSENSRMQAVIHITTKIDSSVPCAFFINIYWKFHQNLTITIEIFCKQMGNKQTNTTKNISLEIREALSFKTWFDKCLYSRLLLILKPDYLKI